MNLRFTAASQHTSAILLPQTNLTWTLFFIQRTFTAHSIIFLKVNIINIWFNFHHKLIWRNIEILLSRSMYRGDCPLQITIRSYNCTGLIFIISLRKRLILFTWLLLRTLQRLNLFKFTFRALILRLPLIIIKNSLLFLIELGRLLS